MIAEARAERVMQPADCAHVRSSHPDEDEIRETRHRWKGWGAPPMLGCIAADLHLQGCPVGSDSQVAMLDGHALIIGRRLWTDGPRVRRTCNPRN